MTLLRQLPVVEQQDGSMRMEFWIDGVVVCKHFFKAAAAIPTKSFDTAVALVQGDTSNKGVLTLCCRDGRESRKKVDTSKYSSMTQNTSRVLSFLDVFFQSKGRRTYVESSPNTTGPLKKALLIRMRWRRVYEDYYVKSAEEKGHAPVTYDVFVATRKRHRPHFRQHRKVKKKQFNHLECGECVRLQSAIDTAKNAESKDMMQLRLDAHVDFQAEFRHNYEEQIEKVLNFNRSYEGGAKDIIMQIDGSGASGTKFCPYYPEQVTDGEKAAHNCLKTSNTFVKVHGWGRIIFQSYSMMEAQGTSVVLDIVFRTIRIVAESCGYKKLRNIYIFMDNAAYNKSHVLLAGLSGLVLLGICRKVKVGYLLVSHTHCDNDREIGLAGTFLCNQNIPSFSEFERLVKQAFHGQGSTEVHQIVGVTNYKDMFQDVDKNLNKISGITASHGFRITARRGALSSEVGVDVYYKENYSKRESWYPRPAPTLPGTGNFNVRFCHPDSPETAGIPLVCESASPVEAKRLRQQWDYRIRYSNGTHIDFRVPCPSLPYEVTRDEVLERLRTARRQELKPDFLAKCNQIKRNILETLQNRGDAAFWPEYVDFFNSLPQREEDNHPSYYNTLPYLMDKFGGDVVAPPVIVQLPQVEQASDYFCPITFEGGPVTAAEKQKVLIQKGLYKPLKRRRKKKAAASVSTPSARGSSKRGRPKKNVHATKAPAAARKKRRGEAVEEEEMREEDCDDDDTDDDLDVVLHDEDTVDCDDNDDNDSDDENALLRNEVPEQPEESAKKRTRSSRKGTYYYEPKNVVEEKKDYFCVGSAPRSSRNQNARYKE